MGNVGGPRRLARAAPGGGSAVTGLKARGTQHVLDLGCGGGRHALLFAEHGFAVEAINGRLDALQTIKCARARARERGRHPQGASCRRSSGRPGQACMTIIGHETSAGVDMASPSPRTFVVLPWTLRYGDEVRDEAEYFKGIKGKPDPKQKKQLASVIAEHTQGWSPFWRPIRWNRPPAEHEHHSRIGGRWFPAGLQASTPEEPIANGKLTAKPTCETHDSLKRITAAARFSSMARSQAVGRARFPSHRVTGGGRPPPVPRHRKKWRASRRGIPAHPPAVPHPCIPNMAFMGIPVLTAVIGPWASEVLTAVIGPSAVLPVVAVIGPSAVLPVVAVIGPSAVLPVVAVIGPSAVLPSANPASRAFKAVAADDEPPLGRAGFVSNVLKRLDPISPMIPSTACVEAQLLDVDLSNLRRQLEASRDYVFAAAGIPQDLTCRPRAFSPSRKSPPEGFFFSIKKGRVSRIFQARYNPLSRTSGKEYAVPAVRMDALFGRPPPGYFWEGSTITISLQACGKFRVVAAWLIVRDVPTARGAFTADAPATLKPMLPLSTAPNFTPKQGQYLAFIYAYTRVLGRPPAEADLQRHFGHSTLRPPNGPHPRASRADPAEAWSRPQHRSPGRSRNARESAAAIPKGRRAGGRQEGRARPA